MPINLDQVVCTGQELNISQCARNQFRVHDCTHYQDASVDCLGRSTGDFITVLVLAVSDRKKN